MPNAKRDSNYKVVMMGIASTTVTVDGVDYVANITPVPVTVDSVTRRVRCTLAGNTGNNATPDREVMRRDDNRQPVLGAETNNSSRTVTPVSIEPANDGVMMQGA